MSSRPGSRPRAVKVAPGLVDEHEVEKLLGLGILFQVVACAVVGVRLLRLAARSRQAPELFLGGAFLLLGGFGYPLSIVARSGSLGDLSTPLLLAALAVQNAACVCMAVATWHTFYSKRRGLGLLAALACVAVAISLVASAVAGTPDRGPAYYLGFAVRMGAFAWAAFESARYYGRLRRQERLGLGDPVVSDRFRLWTLSTASVLAGFAIFLGARLLSLDLATNPVVLLATSAVGIVGGTTMWLAFFPPARYLRRFLAGPAV